VRFTTHFFTPINHIWVVARAKKLPTQAKNPKFLIILKTPKNPTKGKNVQISFY
jgi:hypothetical protein